MTSFGVGQSNNNVQFAGLKRENWGRKEILDTSSIEGDDWWKILSGFVAGVSHEHIKAGFSILPILVFQLENLVH